MAMVRNTALSALLHLVALVFIHVSWLQTVPPPSFGRGVPIAIEIIDVEDMWRPDPEAEPEARAAGRPRASERPEALPVPTPETVGRAPPPRLAPPAPAPTRPAETERPPEPAIQDRNVRERESAPPGTPRNAPSPSAEGEAAPDVQEAPSPPDTARVETEEKGAAATEPPRDAPSSKPMAPEDRKAAPAEPAPQAGGGAAPDAHGVPEAAAGTETAGDVAGALRPGHIDDLLGRLYARLDRMLLDYTERHPDVVALQLTIDALEGDPAPLTGAELHALGRQIAACWARTEPAVEGVVVRMTLQHTGRLGDARITDAARMDSDPAFREAAGRAVAAVRGCSPFRLPIAKFGAWRILEVRFTADGPVVQAGPTGRG